MKRYNCRLSPRIRRRVRLSEGKNEGYRNENRFAALADPEMKVSHHRNGTL
jgi:hypothetical protein